MYLVAEIYSGHFSLSHLIHCILYYTLAAEMIQQWEYEMVLFYSSNQQFGLVMFSLVFSCLAELRGECVSAACVIIILYFCLSATIHL